MQNQLHGNGDITNQWKTDVFRKIILIPTYTENKGWMY